MRSIFLNVCGGLLLFCMLAGCSRSGPPDDTASPRGAPKQMMDQKTKSDKPPMDPSKLPPKFNVPNDNAPKQNK